MMSSNIKYYEIGGISFAVETPVPYEEMHPYSLFSKEYAEPQLRYVFSYVNSLPIPKGKRIFEASYYTAYEDENAFYRYMGFFRDGEALDPEYALAVISKTETDTVRVYIPEDRKVPMKASLIYRTLCLEQMLGRFGGVIFHSSFIEVNGKAVLFTAPSGVGKSTQAELWRQHRGAFVVNGDCSFVKKENGVFKAYGLPFSGTSGICYNKEYPLAAVVYLTQAPQNTLKRLTGANAFRAVYEGIKLSSWSREDAMQITDSVSKIASEVPIYKLDCVPDESAVECLEKAFIIDDL